MSSRFGGQRHEAVAGVTWMTRVGCPLARRVSAILGQVQSLSAYTHYVDQDGQIGDRGTPEVNPSTTAELADAVR